MDELYELFRNATLLEMNNLESFFLEGLHIPGLDEKIQLALEFLKYTHLLSMWPRMQQSSKSTVKAAEFRHQGNLAFKNRKFRDAMILYTESIAAAPVGSQELAFDYGNRSASHLKVKKHAECLLDINRAFQENYPEANRQRLLDRKERCIALIQRFITRYQVSPGDIESFGSIINMEQFVEGFHPDMKDMPSKLRLPEMDFQNRLIPNASDKIKMIDVGNNQRGIVATANIKPGEIIAIEKPVAWTLAIENTTHRSHCTNCFCVTDALIHCPNCSVIMFCSASCRDDAFGLFHRIECEIFSKLPLKDGYRLLKSWVAVRVLLVVTEQGEKLDEIMNNPAYRLPCAESFSHNVNEVFNSHEFASILGHGKSTCDKKLVDLSAAGFDFSSIQTVLIWLHYLNQTAFFGGQNRGNQDFNERLTTRELYVVTLLLKFSRNTFQLMREGLRGNIPALEKGITAVPVGHGLFPLMNIFRHSCDPHASFYSYENNLVCRSIRPIKAGEEIFISYFHPYYSHSKKERITNLREEYNFECTCRPCQHNWPTKDKLPVGFPAVISDNIGAREFQEYSSRFHELLERFDVNELRTSETFEFLREYLSILDKRFEKPCREFVECQRLLDWNLSLTSNFYILMKI